jgi:hypothetical protein
MSEFEFDGNSIQEGISAFEREDYPSALKAFRPHAEQGDARAQFYLGEMYKTGKGVSFHIDEAVHWYRKASEQDYTLAQSRLGSLYLLAMKHRCGPQDEKEAVHWVQKGAKLGDAEAQCRLGELYRLGEGTPNDDKKAVVWYRKAAEQGHGYAMHLLGEMYRWGRGVPQSDEEKDIWLRKAAEQGNVNAQLNLGEIYRNGDGVPQDDKLAVHWYRKAAEQGDGYAQCQLGETGIMRRRTHSSKFRPYFICRRCFPPRSP